MNKAIEIVTLTKVEAANLNSNGTEGVISVLKKVRDPVDLKEYVRISGQSVKFQLKQVLADMGLGDQISPLRKVEAENRKTVNVSEGKPDKYIDDDLFGYMIATGDKTRKRTAPVRTNGMISIFPYQEDRDFGVRYDPSGKEQHNIFETEISTNIMRGNFFIEVDRVGVFEKGEVEDELTIPKEERERRIKVLLQAIASYSGGAHLSRFLTKVYPEAMLVVALNRKIPVVGDNFRLKQEYVNGKYVLDVKLLKEVLITFDEYINWVYLGLLKEKFANLDEISALVNENPKVKVFSMAELKEELQKTSLL